MTRSLYLRQGFAVQDDLFELSLRGILVLLVGARFIAPSECTPRILSQRRKGVDPFYSSRLCSRQWNVAPFS